MLRFSFALLTTLSLPLSSALNCPTATVVLPIDWQNNYGLDLFNHRRSGIEGVGELKEHVYHFSFLRAQQRGLLACILKTNSNKM